MYVKTSQLAIAMFGIILAVTAWFTFDQLVRSEEQSLSEALRDVDMQDGRLVATVNGREIPYWRLVQMEAVGDALPLPAGLDGADRVAMVDNLINRELLTQQATRRGLLGSEAEAFDAVVVQQQMIQEMLEAGSLSPMQIELMQVQSEWGLPVEEWHTSDEVLLSFREAIGRSNLPRYLAGDDSLDSPATQARLEELLDKLRAEAEIVVLLD
jgi:sulfur carrier protein ThiS